jgi:intracellular sulfur oxidation DsrE/DsrF family protein
MAFVTMPATGAETSGKYVYHVTDADKLPFALDDIRDRVKQSGTTKTDIILVVDGPASKLLLKNTATENVRRELASLQKGGVQTSVCGNTMKFYKMQTSDLLPGIVRLEQGSNARLEELKAQDYEAMHY